MEESIETPWTMTEEQQNAVANWLDDYAARKPAEKEGGEGGQRGGRKRSKNDNLQLEGAWWYIMGRDFSQTTRKTQFPPHHSHVEPCIITISPDTDVDTLHLPDPGVLLVLQLPMILIS
jgi:hypothetical protein